VRIIGLDPGQSGGAVLMDDTGIIDRIKFGGLTEHDTAETLIEWASDIPVRAWIEAVHSMPRQGVASSFKFGKHFGFLIGILTACSIPYDLVTPAKWQGVLKCRTKGDKNVSKAAAQRRWPDLRWTHALADAALIAEYGRLQQR